MDSTAWPHPDPGLPNSAALASDAPFSAHPEGAAPPLGEPIGPWADVPAAQWHDWHWQLRNRVKTSQQLGQIFDLDPGEHAWIAAGGGFEVGITPYFASLCLGQAGTPLRRQVLPDSREGLKLTTDRSDPLGEDPHRKAPGVVHKYPDRVLLLVTDTCAAYCRYCTRARWVAAGEESLNSDDLDQALAYISENKGIRDVLISGGDPLLWSSARLNTLLDRLAAISHLRFVRIGTRVPIFLPMRIDTALVHALRPRRIPVFVNVHCNHFRELTATAVAALARLADGGIALGGQTVLLQGINDDAETLRETFYNLLSARVRPYYLFHCDPIVGSGHLRTSVDAGLELMRALIGYTSGMAVPKYCIDLEGGGKVPLWPDYLQTADRDWMVFQSFSGQTYRFANRPDVAT